MFAGKKTSITTQYQLIVLATDYHSKSVRLQWNLYNGYFGTTRFDIILMLQARRLSFFRSNYIGGCLYLINCPKCTMSFIWRVLP